MSAPNVAERVLVAMGRRDSEVAAKTLQRELGLGRTRISQGLYALLLIGFAYHEGKRGRRMWSLTPAGRRGAWALGGPRDKATE